MSYKVTSRLSYGERLKSKKNSIGAGILIFIIATAFLWWNEGRAVRTSRMLDVAEEECVDVADVSSIDPSLNGKLIHAIAVVQTEQRLSDPEYPISAKAVKLERTVEYYQWVETSVSVRRDEFGGGRRTDTTYDYDCKWVSSPVNSNEFADPAYRDKNSVKKIINDVKLVAEDVSFGGYTLPSTLLSLIPCDEPVELPAEMAQDGTVHVSQNVLYYGSDASAPEVGDVRVTFRKAHGGRASVLARVVGDSFETYEAKGASLCTLRMGSHSMESMFGFERKTNKLILWVIRICGTAAVCLVLKMMFGLLVTLLRVFPFFARIVNVGLTVVCDGIGTAWSLTVMAIAWISYRPFVAVGLLIVACGLVYRLVWKGKKTPTAVAVADASTGKAE